MSARLKTIEGMIEEVQTTPISEVYLTKKNTITIHSPPYGFHADIVLDEIKYFKDTIEKKYDIKRSPNVNYYVIVRTATGFMNIVNELEKISEDFYRDRSLANITEKTEAQPVKFRRIGNVKNVVFYHCPVFTDLRNYAVEFGLKVNQHALLSDSLNQLTKTIILERPVIKKSPQDETTKILPHPHLSKDLGVSLDDLEKEVINIPNSVPKNKLPQEELKALEEAENRGLFKTSVPISHFHMNEMKALEESLKEPPVKVKVPNYVGPVFGPTLRKSELPLEGRELEEQKCAALSEELRNEYKKLEEKETVKPVEVKKDVTEWSGCYFTETKTNDNKYSIPVGQADYETKARAFSQIKDGHSLPNTYLNSVKGFYLKEKNEVDLFNRLSDESILAYKIKKIREFAEKYKNAGDVYSKNDLDNMVTHRSVLVKHNVLSENNIPFILVKTDDFDFNFYGNEIKDKQMIQEKSYPSFFEMVTELKEKAKDNLIFVKQVTQEEYYENLTPSLKFFNEYKVRCYFLPKNKF